jgi:hypothetical protein
MFKRNIVSLRIYFPLVFLSLALNCLGDDCYVSITRLCDDNPPRGQCQEPCFMQGQSCGVAALLSEDLYDFVSPQEIGQGNSGYEEGPRVHCGDWLFCRCRLQGLFELKCKPTLFFISDYTVGTLTPVGDECINVVLM